MKINAKKTRYYCTKLQSQGSVYKPKAVFSASERQYTAAGGDVQAPRGIYV